MYVYAPVYIHRCTTLCGRIKEKSRDTSKILPWKQGNIWNVSRESYAHNWWMNLLIQRCCYSNPQCIVTVTRLVSYTKCYLNIVGKCKHPTPWLAICTYNLANKCDIYLWDSYYWCCYFGNKVIHNSCNMAMGDLPDMYTQSPRATVTWPFVICLICIPSSSVCGPRTSGIHIRQIPHGHVTTITYIPVYTGIHWYTPNIHGYTSSIHGYICVYPCIPVYTDVYPCILLLCILMYTHVPMYTCVYQWLPM